MPNKLRIVSRLLMQEGMLVYSQRALAPQQHNLKKSTSISLKNVHQAQRSHLLVARKMSTQHVCPENCAQVQTDTALRIFACN
mmetsp:Transcript_50401/g.94130  ORF Transcript_50401/g.94130 Transcript_50401/m.94130 type:complete len:83 (-) Transcript_50401:555-803(-)